MHDRAHRLAGDLGIAVGDRHRVLLVQAQEHLRFGVAEQVDQAVVQAAIRGAGVERDIGQANLPEHQRHHIAAPVIAGFVRQCRALDRAGPLSCVVHCLAPPFRIGWD